MQRRNNQFNPKRRLREHTEVDLAVCAELASKVSYGGNPEHKKNPGDFGLIPPSGPRAGKSLCDIAQIVSRKEALEYLKQGLTKGLISDRHKGQWPQNVWAVTGDGIPLEAQLENPESGSYHGYPMPPSDPMAEEVLQRWGRAP
jgi:hypothetical protein